MKLSIIIPLYNKEKYIDRCLKSLLSQDISPEEYEIIIIDDGSTDSGAAIAKDFAKEHSNIHLFPQPNKGLSATRNRGIDLAKGDYVYFLDADDYIANNVLKYLIELSEKNNLEILGFNTRYTSEGSLTQTSTENPENLNVEVMDGMTYIAKQGFRNEVWWYIIQKKFLLNTEIRFVIGRFLEDSMFTNSLFLKANKMAKANIDVHRFVKVPNSIQTSDNSEHLLKFIDDLVFAIEEIDSTIKNLNHSHPHYSEVVKDFKRKQQSYVFTLFIKAFRCRLLKFSDLEKILSRLKELNVYPINLKIGGIGNRKTRLLYSLIIVPILNNKVLLFPSLKIKRLLSH